MNNNNSNNNRSAPQLQLTVQHGGTGTQSNAFDNRVTPPTTGTGTTTEKREHVGTSQSSNPEEK
jgi:hypothetical protein